MSESHLFPDNDKEIVTSRIVNASQELTFRAWTEPEHLKKWWGPNGFTNTFNEYDLRVGGKWSFVMHAPVKGNFTNECEFTHIEKPSLIAWKRYSKPLFRVMTTFEKITEDKTKIVFKQIFDTVEECEKLRPHVEDKNEENFDRLENELLNME